MQIGKYVVNEAKLLRQRIKRGKNALTIKYSTDALK